MKKKFKCEVDCANCAAKVEEAIRKVPGVIDVSVNFLTQKTMIEAADGEFDAVVQAALKAAKKVEDEFEMEIA
ncbi:MAG: cation transporter [Lachnospiraceae bacterium]|nr:cation transporter [Lachnospiraceae bacterium]